MDDLFKPDYRGPGLAGVDEVGRGPLAGDVVAAAVILDPQRPVIGLQRFEKTQCSSQGATGTGDSRTRPGLVGGPRYGCRD